MSDQHEAECAHKVKVADIAAVAGVPITWCKGKVHAIVTVRCIHCGCTGKAALEIDPVYVWWG
jgi:hypothetical protein